MWHDLSSSALPRVFVEIEKQQIPRYAEFARLRNDNLKS